MQARCWMMRLFEARGRFKKISWAASLGRSSQEGHDISCPYGWRHDGVLGLCVYTARNGTVEEGRRLADWDYWIAAGWEDDAVSDFDEGERRGEGRRVGYACWRGEGAGAAVVGVGQAIQPEKDYVCDGSVCGPGRNAEGEEPRRLGALARGGHDCACEIGRAS